MPEVDAKTHRLRGDEYFNCGKYEAAIREYSQVLRILPDDAATYCERADCYLLLSKRVSEKC